MVKSEESVSIESYVTSKGLSVMGAFLTFIKVFRVSAMEFFTTLVPINID